MIGANERVLAVIPARGGSKGLPRKNVLPLGGRPLITWSLDAARAVSRIDRVVVSTDDPEIRQTVEEWAGCEVIPRPEALAGDAVATEPVLLHTADQLGENYDWVLLLQPTSPLRQPADIEAALNLAEATAASSVISVVTAPKPLRWHFGFGANGELIRLFDGPINARRQDQPDVVVPNGAIYLARLEVLREWETFYGLNMRAFRMPENRSIDIDSDLDLALAQLILDRAV